MALRIHCALGVGLGFAKGFALAKFGGQTEGLSLAVLLALGAARGLALADFLTAGQALTCGFTLGNHFPFAFDRFLLQGADLILNFPGVEPIDGATPPLQLESAGDCLDTVGVRGQCPRRSSSSEGS